MKILVEEIYKSAYILIMRITAFLDDEKIILELGERIKAARIRASKTQAQLALESGVAKSTIERAEKGESIQLLNIVKIMRALNCISNLETILPSTELSPLEYANEKSLPLRVRSPSPKYSGSFKWGDEK